MLSEGTGLLESPSSQGPGSREHLARPGVCVPCWAFQAGTWCLSSQPCQEPGAWSSLEESCQGSSGASWPDRNPPSAPTSLPLLGWAPAPRFQHLGPNQTSFENCRCLFPATLKVLLKASLFEAGQVKPQPRPGLLNYPGQGPPPPGLLSPHVHRTPPAQSAGRDQAVRVRAGSRGWQGGWGQQLGNGNRGWAWGLPGGRGSPSLKGVGGKGVPRGLDADRTWAVGVSLRLTGG